MPLMRIAVCFDGWITSHDHTFTKPLWALSHPPRVLFLISHIHILCHSCSYCPVSYFVPLYPPPLLFPPHTCWLSSPQSSPTLSSTWFPAVPFHHTSILCISTFTTRHSPSHSHTYTPSHTFPSPTPQKSPTNNTYSTGIQVPVKKSIDRFHVTSLPPCWRTITKDSSLASIVSSTNMAATSLSYDSLGIDCKPSNSLVWYITITIIIM